MGEFRILAAVQYLDRGEVKDIADLLEADVADVFRTCRALERDGHVESVGPMTYRITDRGVDYLDGWIPPEERVDAAQFGDGDASDGRDDDSPFDRSPSALRSPSESSFGDAPDPPDVGFVDDGAGFGSSSSPERGPDGPARE